MIQALLDPQNGYSTSEPLRPEGPAPSTKLPKIYINKSKVAGTRNTTGQKEEAVQKALNEGLMKSSALAAELRKKGVGVATPSPSPSLSPVCRPCFNLLVLACNLQILI